MSNKIFEPLHQLFGKVYIKMHELKPGKDLTDLIDKVSDGRIMRGGTQGKYVVFKQDNDVIIQLFGAAKK